jgi:hypothetical protein
LHGCCTTEDVAPNGDATSFLIVGTVRDVLLATMGFYDVENFGPALARYEELKDGEKGNTEQA